MYNMLTNGEKANINISKVYKATDEEDFPNFAVRHTN